MYRSLVPPIKNGVKAPFPNTVGRKTAINHPERISRVDFPFDRPIFQNAINAPPINVEQMAMPPFLEDRDFCTKF